MVVRRSFTRRRKVRAAPPTRLTRHTRHTNRSFPLVEHVKHVGLAELDAHRPPPRAFGVVTLEIPVDAAHRELQRNPARRPAADLFECRADDSNEMAIVFAAQIRLQLPTIVLCTVFVTLGFGIWDLGFGICHHSQRTSPETTRTI